MPDETLDPAAIRASYDRMLAVLVDIMTTVGVVSTRRCPYRDRADRCTAQFGCRNQRPAATEDGGRICGGDDRLDYRSAWESK